MKRISKTIACLSLLVLSVVTNYAQDVRVKQSELPYSIPFIEQPSKGNKIIYQWVENNQIVKSSNSINYVIPKGKKPGIYTYVQQVKCEGCTDWLSSNSFVVEIYNGNSTARSFNIPFLVKFSPQKDLAGYLEDLITVIDETQQKLDISLYTIDDYDVYLSLKRAAARGVQIRMLYDGAIEDKNKTSGTVSHRLEEIGIDVKYVNKTNHHKFTVSDDNYLMTGSGNWDSEANWVYDENALSIVDPEIILRYRAEFELLWNNSREFGQSHIYTPTTPSSLLNSIIDNPNVDAVFTSSNYSISNSSTYGPTFSKIFNKQDVADKIVSLINQAQTSIKISANHLRSRPICEALIQKKIQNPAINIKVYTDQQEYITDGYNNYQITQRQQCLNDAATPAQERDCLEENFLYSYNLILAGIDVRFKSFSYKWDFTTASIMHHKYAIFDDNIVATGSYNYSYNSETNSMENVVIFNSTASSTTVTNYVANFNEIWDRGRIENYYNDLLAQITSSNRYTPLLFPAISLTHGEYANIKQQIESACPSVMHQYFKNNGQLYTEYLKNVELVYDANNNVITKITNNSTLPFSLDYSYNAAQNKFTNVTFHSSDNVNYFENYQYDASSNLVSFQTPSRTMNFSYGNNDLTGLNCGQGDYNWLYSTLSNGTNVKLSNSNRGILLDVDWNDNGSMTKCIDADNRNLQLYYDDNEEVTSVSSSNRNISFNYSLNQTNTSTNNGEVISFNQSNVSTFDIISTGTVATSTTFILQEQSDKKQALAISVNSSNVASGSGKNASINYLFDVYGRVVNAGNLSITRIPYSGEIVTLADGNIQETRSYDDWSLLTQQVVKYNGLDIYKANYQYDGVQRIKQMIETISGIATQYNYQYNASGQLEKVYRNNVLTESYNYDSFGNRINASLNNLNYSYQSNNTNRLNSYSWF